jgi:hypothetical protein
MAMFPAFLDTCTLYGAYLCENRAARLDELLTRADEAARRIVARQAERHVSSEYAARMELEAQTQATAGRQAEAREEAEPEL